jgi:acyl carrier protein
VNLMDDVLLVVDGVLGLHGRSAGFGPDTPMLGALPELDSMAVVGLITALEAQFGLTIDDDDIDAATFATVGSLVDFVGHRITV